ncbi:MAG: prephenate dehydrogenase/arogenate dehydrogenase family protein [Gammaproteobacteria bacterium]|nr:prephenate dehydrogenase/arogenate dehydrogenase family protein [Gammaproteobacteria bacterium]
MLLAVVGTGLIGGSFALAARRQRLFDEIVGVEPDAAHGRRALALGLVDRLAEDVPPNADAVLLAGPSQTIAPWVVRLAGHAGVVFDAGSVKGAVLEQVRGGCAGELPPRFVPCHPLAGSERSGPDAAAADLYRDAEVIVTPGSETDTAAVEQVSGWWRAIGARVLTMDPDSHDAILAVTSHLPHLLAFAYLQQVRDGHLPHTAGGFRDFTRIGAADADMWAPIFELNRTPLLAALDDLEASLIRARTLLNDADGGGLRDFIRQAGTRRGAPDRD